MPRAALQAFEGNFQDEALLSCCRDRPYRTEPVDRVLPDKLVELFELLIGKAEVGLSDRRQFMAVCPVSLDAEGEVRIEAGSPAMRSPSRQVKQQLLQLRWLQQASYWER